MARAQPTPPPPADEGARPEDVERFLRSLDDQGMAAQVAAIQQEWADVVRSAVVDDGRIDVLSEEILDRKLFWHHRKIQQSQSKTKKSQKHLTLAFRGGGKSTVGNIDRIIFEILRNPNIRILLVSNTEHQAEVFLREVKTHFEANEKLIRVFGSWVGTKWDTKEIIVPQRNVVHKEATVTCIGIGGATASRHYDLIIADDLVDEETSRTELQRDRLRVWFYKSLMPTLLSFGRIFIIGTRWHPKDLYNMLVENSDVDEMCVVPAILSNGESAWPEEFPIAKLHEDRRKMGLPIFDSQFQMTTKTMTGSIFSWDDFHWYTELPVNVVLFQGVDLAIGKKAVNDFFAHATVALERIGLFKRIYVVKVHQKKLSFHAQTAEIARCFFDDDPIRVGIESNFYQEAQLQNVKKDFPGIRAVPVYTQTDKTTRAQKLQAKCQAGEILFRKDQTELIEVLLGMPDVDHDDLFDAVEIACSLALKGTKKKREREPDLI